MLSPTLLLLVAARGAALVVAGDAYLAAPHPVAPLGAHLVVNLEGAHCLDASGPSQLDTGAPRERVRAPRWRLCHTAHTVDTLRGLSVVAASTANNHADDGGAEGRAATRGALDAVGIAALEPGGRRCVEGGACVTTWDDRAPIAPALETLARARRRASTMRPREVVLAHRSATDAAAFADALRALADAGADVVVGTGSHRPGPVETRGTSVIYHDVGDLVFDCRCSDSTVGLLVTIPLDGPPFARLVAVAHGSDDVIGRGLSAEASESVGRDLIARSRALATTVVLVDDELRFIVPQERSSRAGGEKGAAP